MVVSKFIKWWIFAGVIGFAISLVGYIAFQNKSKIGYDANSIDEDIFRDRRAADAEVLLASAASGDKVRPIE